MGMARRYSSAVTHSVSPGRPDMAGVLYVGQTIGFDLDARICHSALAYVNDIINYTKTVNSFP